jgi:ligand-binding SRPBCC domain-containing protein
MRIELATRLAAPPEQVWLHVRTPRLLMHVASPLVRFVSREPGGFPETWTEGPHRVWMLLFGVLPLGPQTVGIEFPPPPEGGFRVRDNGSGLLARTWDHVIDILPDGSGGALYSDRVEVKAGLLTPLVAGFAMVFYRWRQYRWRQFVRRGLRY